MLAALRAPRCRERGLRLDSPSATSDGVAQLESRPGTALGARYCARASPRRACWVTVASGGAFDVRGPVTCLARWAAPASLALRARLER